MRQMRRVGLGKGDEQRRDWRGKKFENWSGWFGNNRRRAEQALRGIGAMVGVFFRKTVQFPADRREQQQRDEDVPESVHGGKCKAGSRDGKREVVSNVLSASAGRSKIPKGKLSASGTLAARCSGRLHHSAGGASFFDFSSN
jgi:hypothetical protein